MRGKAEFWQRWVGRLLNERQIKLINRLQGGFEGKLTKAKWAAIVKCSTDTALRDISDLLACGLLRKLEGGGRSTAYELAKGDEPAGALPSSASSSDEDLNQKGL